MNYARWFPTHPRDMGEKHPQLANAFQRGALYFVVHKSSRDFSAIAIDQAHEQANAVIKTDVGAIGVSEDPSALGRWMIAGPEVSQLVAQYEIASEAKETVVIRTITNRHQKCNRISLREWINCSRFSQIWAILSRKRAGTYSRWTQTTLPIPVQLN